MEVDETSSQPAESGAQGELPVLTVPRSRLSTRRNAAAIARHQIREWCNRDSPLAELSMDVGETSSQSAESSHSATQDLERRAEELGTAELQQIRERRKRKLFPEPNDGFILKMRGSAQRRFKESDNLEDLINFVGSQEHASKDFKIKLRMLDATICSWDCQGDLKSAGIVCSAVIDVEWDADKPLSSSTENSYDEIIGSLGLEGNNEDELSSYDQLIGSLEGNNEDELSFETDPQQEASPTVPTVPTLPLEDIRDILLSWKFKTLDLDNHQKIVVSRRPESLWQHSLRRFGHVSFDVAKTLKVEFRNDAGEDEGGLRREYLETLVRQMLASPYLEDTGNGYMVTSNYVGLVNGCYRIIGKMLATCLIQGGPFIPVFCHSLVTYGLNGLGAATIETVTHEETRKLIEKIKEESNVPLLANNERIGDLLEGAGIHLRLSEQSKSCVISALIAHHSQLTKKKAMLDQLWEGAECLGLQTFLKEHPAEVTKLLCKCCGVEPKLTGDSFMVMVEVEKFGEDASNDRQASEDVAQNYESFIYDAEEGNCTYPLGNVNIGDILKFVTGCSTTPPGGFDDKFRVHFTKDKCYPHVSTCTFALTLPLHLVTYTTFKQVMIEAIVSGKGFGLI